MNYQYSMNSCEHYWNEYCYPMIKINQNWNENEDQQLIDLVHQYGSSADQWKRISSFFVNEIFSFFFNFYLILYSIFENIFLCFFFFFKAIKINLFMSSSLYDIRK